MLIPFFKYQGAGNDFVMIDNRETQYLDRKDCAIINYLCDRRFGIGADGLILLQDHQELDFEMIYFNADGTEGSLCGNGGRCTVAFARVLNLIQSDCRFMAIDGIHEATINEDGNWVELKMADLNIISNNNDHYVLDTGSPHYVTFVKEIENLDVFNKGRSIRYSPIYAQNGINVNFVESTKKGINIATYERGVENETLACGTGVTAAAIAYYFEAPQTVLKLMQQGGLPIKAKGGNLLVRYETDGQNFSDIWLCGPAEYVFQGEVEVKKI